MSSYHLLVSDAQGNIREHPTLSPLGATFGGIRPLAPLIPLPQGATLCLLPGRLAIGENRAGEQVTLSPSPDKPVYPVGALLPTGFGRLQLPAFARADGAQTLPLFGYTAVATRHGRLYAAALRVDVADTWQPSDYHTAALHERVAARLQGDQENALLGQLALCAQHYGCYTAQNVFYERWEGALPASPSCAAQCVGCISEQITGEVPSPQQRLTFAPTPEQMAALGIAHLTSAPRPMISFGQGCEGDPLNRARPIARAIRMMREHTARGVINMNTNAWNTRGLADVIDAGLNRIRISTFSATPAGYHAYYQPRGYSLADVERSAALCHARGVYVALNLLTFPGYTDASDEIEALCQFAERTGVDEIQVRTLNIDPDMLRAAVPTPQGEEMGIARFLDMLRQRLPRVVLATHSRPPAADHPESIPNLAIAKSAAV